MFSLPHFGRQDACHDITKSVDSQTNISFSENDCIIADILQICLSNKWLQIEDLGKQESIWKNSNWVEADANGSQLSRNKFLVIAVKQISEVPRIVGPIFLDFNNLLPNILYRMVGVYYSWE